MAKRDIQVLKFDAAKVPTPLEIGDKSNDKYVKWGADNLYPNHLLKYYNESPTHAAIVNSKASMILKGGLKYAAGGEVNVDVNGEDTFGEFIDKVVKSYLLFNAFCVEVIYNQFQKPIEYHFVDLHKVRMNAHKTKFWYSDNWQLGEKPIIFGRWKANSNDTLSKFFYYDGYQPSLLNTYPEPEYKHIIKTLQTDIAIRDFNLNNILNHFSVSTLITFFRGSNIPDEQKQNIIKSLEKTYTGPDGKKLIIDFQDAGQQGADVKNIAPNDWSTMYELIAKKVTDDILIGHQVTSPMLFGVKTEGQLGGATELETAYEIFKDNYIKNKRTELLSAFNLLFSDSEIITGKLAFTDAPLFSARISEDTKTKILTINELRKEQGLQPIAGGDRFIGEAAPVQTPQSVQQSKFDANSFHLTDEDFEKISHMGITYDDFEFMEEGEYISSKEDFSKIELRFETEQEIADYITENGITDTSVKGLKADIRKDLGISVSNSELEEILRKLSKSGLLNVVINDGNIKVSKPEEPKKQVQVMYSYEVRAGLGEPIIEKTRPFCRKLVQNNRLYTRQEIQTMASIFGYDIFQYGGGWYKNPQTGELTSHCRHQFRARTVVRRNRG